MSDDQVLAPDASNQAAMLEFGLLEFVLKEFGAPRFAATSESEFSSR
jgi:hypothetical protein